MRILANPALLRATIVLVCAGGAFVVGLVCIRLLRQQITEEGELGEKAPHSLDALPMTVYNTVILQLKQQKQELLKQLQAEQQRAKQSETLNQAVWLNVSSGVLIFGANGLVKTFNPAAKVILGFASMNGMSAEDIFRGALVRKPEQNPEVNDELMALAEEVNAVLRKGSLRRDCEAEYETPAGDKRVLRLSILPVSGSDGNLLGIACLIDNLSRPERLLAKNAAGETLELEQVVSPDSEISGLKAAGGQ